MVFQHYNKEFETTSDPDSEPTALTPTDTRVRCRRCHWEGRASELKAIFVIHLTTTEALEAGCPACFSDQYLEYEE